MLSGLAMASPLLAMRRRVSGSSVAKLPLRNTRGVCIRSRLHKGPNAHERRVLKRNRAGVDIGFALAGTDLRPVRRGGLREPEDAGIASVDHYLARYETHSVSQMDPIAHDRGSCAAIGRTVREQGMIFVGIDV